MANKSSWKDWFLDDMSPEAFAKLSGEERLCRLMRHELEDLSGETLAARTQQITKGADGFVRELRRSRERSSDR